MQKERLIIPAIYGNTQWDKFENLILSRMHKLANTPEMGMTLGEVASNAYRYPDMHYVYYDLKRSTDVIFLGKRSSNLAPEKHQFRTKNRMKSD